METVIDYLYPSKQNSPKVSLGQEVGGGGGGGGGGGDGHKGAL